MTKITKAVQGEIDRDGATIESVLKALSGQPTGVTSTKEAVAPSELPKGLGKALDMIKNKWNSVVVTVVRALTTEEQKDLLEEAGGLAKARLAVTKREALIKEYFINHINNRPEAKDAPLDDKGNAILAKPGEPFVIEIPGAGKLTQTYRKGSVSVSVDALEELVDSGVITKHQFYKMTTKREFREFDPEGALEQVRKNPELLDKIKGATEVGSPGFSLKFN